jgi:hypothetical protein
MTLRALRPLRPRRSKLDFLHMWRCTFGICIWEGESVESVRDVVEGAVGPWANNEYIEMRVDGLDPQLSN